MLKLNTNSERSPKGLFTVPDIEGLTGKIRATYDLWYRVWVEEYLLVMADMSKWTVGTPNLEVNDIVLFKLTESKMSNDWRLGKINSFPKIGRDGTVHEVEISYKLCNKPGEVLDK